MSAEPICRRRELPQEFELTEAGPDDLRRLFRRHAAAVAVITATHQGAPVGLLVTSLASVSAAPALVSFNVSVRASSWPALQDAVHLGVHVLEAEQEELATRFARSGADRFSAATGWQSGPFGVPVLEGVAAWSIAEIDRRIPAGDHVIVLARLLHVASQDDAVPLLHHDGAYHRPVRTPETNARLAPRARR